MVRGRSQIGLPGLLEVDCGCEVVPLDPRKRYGSVSHHNEGGRGVAEVEGEIGCETSEVWFREGPEVSELSAADERNPARSRHLKLIAI